MDEQIKKFQRRSIRVKGYDYSQAGAYFVTLCTQDRALFFGETVGETMQVNRAGQMIQTGWDGLPQRFLAMIPDAFVVMPNHVHGVILLSGADIGGDHEDRPYETLPPDDKGRGESCLRPCGTKAGTIGRILQAFKSITTHQYILGVKNEGWIPFPGRLWQCNYYEHIIRDEESLNRIREYILYNPLSWSLDRENPHRRGEDSFDRWLAGFKQRPSSRQPISFISKQDTKDR
jgi:REP element-mobilizing transposase RayT